jgi:ABC-type ATPase with predicted acetyltransferase domain
VAVELVQQVEQLAQPQAMQLTVILRTLFTNTQEEMAVKVFEVISLVLQQFMRVAVVEASMIMKATTLHEIMAPSTGSGLQGAPMLDVDQTELLIHV